MNTDSLLARLALGFFKIMGISGWVMVAAMFCAAVAYHPTNNGYGMLYYECLLIFLAWIFARGEHHVHELVIGWHERRAGSNKPRKDTR